MSEQRREFWAPVEVGRDRRLIYGPRLGRLYLVSQDQLGDNVFRAILGLREQGERGRLDDPAHGIDLDQTGLTHIAKRSAPDALARMYRLFHWSRRCACLRAAARHTHAHALHMRRRRAGRTRHQVHSIGRMISSVERAIGFADCYPRALLTLYLAVLSGLRCTLAVGVLAPTRKMHAWCAVEGIIPYEPLPEHYLYQPLWLSEFEPLR